MLVTSKEKELIFNDRPANRTSKLVEFESALGDARCGIIKKVTCIQSVAAKILKCRAVELIAAKLCHHADLAARSRAKLGRKVG